MNTLQLPTQCLREFEMLKPSPFQSCLVHECMVHEDEGMKITKASGTRTQKPDCSRFQQHIVLGILLNLDSWCYVFACAMMVRRTLNVVCLTYSLWWRSFSRADNASYHIMRLDSDWSRSGNFRYRACQCAYPAEYLVRWGCATYDKNSRENLNQKV